MRKTIGVMLVLIAAGSAISLLSILLWAHRQYTFGVSPSAIVIALVLALAAFGCSIGGALLLRRQISN
jgi:hypothetical protein